MPTRPSQLVQRCVVLFTVCSLAHAAFQHPTAAAEKDADVPVRRVVMFSSGVAYYEHNGFVEDDSQLKLKFNVKDINDLLKSMVLQDLGGGTVSTVTYGSKDPVTRTLKTFSIDLTQESTLPQLLAQIRGEEIQIDAPTPVKGRIVSVEKRRRKIDENETAEVWYLTLLTDEGLRSISLENVGRIKLSDPELDAELRKALLVLAAAKNKDKKTVTLSFLGKGKRQVRVGYIQESPIWKTSYRLVLDDEEAPFLQGWAIVENTTESDWQNVDLTLVSGRPISFRMDLYQPLYVDRPLVEPELYSSLRPQTYDQSLRDKEADFRRAGKNADSLAKEESRQRAPRDPGARLADEAFGGRYLKRAEAKEDAKLDRIRSAKSVATAGDVGELFQYRIATPVSLERQRSAMLPIVNQNVQGEKVSIYNQNVQAKHPLNGLKLKNTTQLHLMQGPITVFDGGAYAGDAKIQDLPPGSERLLSYALDLNVEVAPRNQSAPEELVSVRIAKGVLYATRRYERTHSYVIKNSGSKVKKVLVEYPIDANWTLIEPKEPAEKTRDLYRFAVQAEPGKPAELHVKEERIAQQTIYLTSASDSTIQFYLSQRVVSQEIKDALAEIIKQKRAIEEVVKQRKELERRIQVVSTEQDRIRRNMAQLPKDSDLFRRYVQKFTKQEDEIETLREQVTESLKEERKLRSKLDDYLLNLKLE